ncbi:TatD family hydrolase [Telmatospirillum siberiense]|uniref:LuxR family transcriptional regulator n=1 Tax=Telmatospirillum siberiense TaxID=382514 RepID=A0A2N3PS50_9PROT|nr:TatD family hydrolase [Telmatospirillum siberiense]PKU23206.1 LuxR family transcriptional regulator [Telmatospirillum siberiense]
MLVDSHCHLDFPDFQEDLDDLLGRAAAAGVGLMVSIGTRISQFDKVLSVAERYENVYCTVGVHPHEAGEEGAIGTADLIALARHPKVIGFGETGLDYFYDHSPRELQQAAFRNHIAAARETGLPVIVHTRDADDDTVAILTEEAATGPFTGVIHCFSSSRQLAEKSLDLGLYISLSGIITFNKAEELRQTVRDLPLNRLLVETDAPYLAPIPKRGKRNEPAFVAHTAAKLAELKGVEPDALARITTDNFFRLFTKVTR